MQSNLNDQGNKSGQLFIYIHLASSTFGVVCVTLENLNSPWLLFEAGAISRSLEAGRVVPLLVGLTQSQLHGPLSQFQAVQLDKDGIWRLVDSLHAATNSRLSSEEQRNAFDALWPLLEKEITSLPAYTDSAGTSDDDSDTVLLRGILDEIRGLRVAPDEQSILRALNTLNAQAEGEILYLENRHRLLFEDGPEARSVSTLLQASRERIRRIRRAIRIVQGEPRETMKATAVEVIGLSDLRAAAELLADDLERREYLCELHGDFNGPVHLQLGEDMVKLARIQKLMNELEISIPPQDES